MSCDLPRFGVIFWIGPEGWFGTTIRAITGHGITHCELLFPDGVSYTAYPNDGVVAKKRDLSDPNWLHTALPDHRATLARDFCIQELGCPYDWKGILGSQLFKANKESPTKWFCSELCVAALQHAGLIPLSVAPATIAPHQLYHHLRQPQPD